MPLEMSYTEETSRPAVIQVVTLLEEIQEEEQVTQEVVDLVNQEEQATQEAVDLVNPEVAAATQEGEVETQEEIHCKDKEEQTQSDSH